MSTTQTNRTLPPPVGGDPLLADPLLADRLARLANRRPGASGGPPTAPPLRTTRTAPRPGPRPPANPQPTARRRHPAKGSRAAALVMSIGSTAALTAYFYQADSSAASGTGAAPSATALQPSVVVVPATNVPAVTAASTAATTASPATASPATASPATTAVAPAAVNTLADGTFIGQTFTNRWGPVQVQVTVSGGQITDVATLQTPGGHRKSVQINDIAAPMLRTEALAAQSADIDTVSGATYTSNGYRQSLQSALDVAKAQATANAG